MSEEATTQGASEGASAAAGTPAAGAAGDGATGGTQAGGESITPERFATLESQLRGLQSTIDRIAAGNVTPSSSKNEATTEGAASAGPSTAEILAEFERRQDLKATAATLKQEFSLANPALFENATEFENTEALRAAIEESHKAVEKLVADQVAAREQALREEFEKAGGKLPAPPGGQGSTGGGDPTLEQLNALPQDEYEALMEKDPDLLNRVLRARSAN